MLPRPPAPPSPVPPPLPAHTLPLCRTRPEKKTFVRVPLPSAPPAEPASTPADTPSKSTATLVAASAASAPEPTSAASPASMTSPCPGPVLVAAQSLPSILPLPSSAPAPLHKETWDEYWSRTRPQQERPYMKEKIPCWVFFLLALKKFIFNFFSGVKKNLLTISDEMVSSPSRKKGGVSF
jgi:hypothetical protein